MINSIDDLRDSLFAQFKRLEDVKQSELDTECKRTMHMVVLAETIIDSARVENEFLAITKGKGTGFIPTKIEDKK